MFPMDLLSYDSDCSSGITIYGSEVESFKYGCNRQSEVYFIISSELVKY